MNEMDKLDCCIGPHVLHACCCGVQKGDEVEMRNAYADAHAHAHAHAIKGRTKLR